MKAANIGPTAESANECTDCTTPERVRKVPISVNSQVRPINTMFQNLTITGVQGGTYMITTLQPRYLNVIAANNKLTPVTANRVLSPLEMKGGNAIWRIDDGHGGLRPRRNLIERRAAARIQNRKHVRRIRGRWHRHIAGVQQKRIGLLAAHTAVAADEFLHRRHRSIGIHRTQHHDVACVRKIGHAPHLRRA